MTKIETVQSLGDTGPLQIAESVKDLQESIKQFPEVMLQEVGKYLGPSVKQGEMVENLVQSYGETMEKWRGLCIKMEESLRDVQNGTFHLEEAARKAKERIRWYWWQVILMGIASGMAGALLLGIGSTAVDRLWPDSATKRKAALWDSMTRQYPDLHEQLLIKLGTSPSPGRKSTPER